MTSGNKYTFSLKKRISYLLPFFLTIFFLYFAFKNVDIGTSLNQISKVSFFWLIIFVSVFLISHFIRALRWKYIIHSVKPDASVWHLFGATMIGYGVNCVVPRLGELYRALFLGRWESISRSSMLGTIIVERVIDIVGLIFAVLISILIFPGNLLSEIVWLKSALVLVFLLITLLIFFLILLVKFKEKFYNIILKFVGKISKSVADKLGYIFHMFIDGFASLSGRKNYSAVVFLTVVIMLIYGINSYFGFLMLRMDAIKDVTFSMAWILMTISAFGIIIPTPGGTGSYHAITILVLVSLFHFSNEVSAAYALLTHFISYIIFIIATISAVYLANKSRISKGEAKENFFTVFKTKPGE